MTHPLYKNSYFIDEDGNKVFVSIDLENKGEGLNMNDKAVAEILDKGYVYQEYLD